MSTAFKRPKGQGNIPDTVKLDILQQKTLKLNTQGDIAKKYGISRVSVCNMSPDDLSPESQLKFDSFIARLERVRNKALNAIENKLDEGLFRAEHLAGLFTTINNASRLENDQPTSITAQQNIEPIALAIQSAWNKYKLFCEQNNIEYPSESDLIERINRVANERNVDAKMLAERVLKAD